MISTIISGDREVVVNLRATGPRIVESIQRRLLRIVIYLQRYIILNKLEGQVLHHRTGNLERNLVYTEPEISGGVISATVGVTGLAPYGKIHEYGGTIDIREHMSRSRNGKEFSVRAHLATFPERSFLRTSLHENEFYTQEQIDEAAKEAL